MDDREWRDHQREKIRWRIMVAVEVANLSAKRDLAIMAILLGFASGAVLAGATRQTPVLVAIALAASGLAASGAVGALLGRHGASVERIVTTATQEADTFMSQQGEPDHDGTQTDPSGT